MRKSRVESKSTVPDIDKLMMLQIETVRCSSRIRSEEKSTKLFRKSLKLIFLYFSFVVRLINKEAQGINLRIKITNS